MNSEQVEDLRRLEAVLIDLVADTGDLSGPQQPIMARNRLLGALQSVQAMLSADGDFPSEC
jgi:hypothetical protein